MSGNPDSGVAVHRTDTDLHDDSNLKPSGKVTEVQGDSQFYESVTAAPLNPWSRTSLQLYCILLVAALNATASGFDGVRAHAQQTVIRIC